MKIPSRVIRRGVVTSTMDEIDALAATGAPEGTVVVAEVQTAGRGRAGRTWEAEAGTAVLASFLLRPSLPADRLTTLPLLAGVAVAEALERCAPVTCQVKWPNDVLIGGRKVAGLLMTTRAAGTADPYVNLGIGINVNLPAEALPDGATSLIVERGVAVDREAVLAALFECLDAAYEWFLAAGGRPSLDPWRSRAALLGERVQVVTPDGALAGVAVDVDPAGALRIALDDGRIHTFYAGDLRRGPRRAEQDDG